MKNNQVSIEVRSDGRLFALDLTDRNNEPALFTTTKRGLPKAIAFIEQHFSDTTRIYEVIAALQLHGIRFHSWCMVD